MTQQPPDEQPTVAWTPPEEPPPEAAPVAPDAPAAPDADAAPPLTPPAAAPPPPATDVPTPEPATPESQSPLISWAPSSDAGAAAAGAAGAGAGAAAQPASVTGWAPPGAGIPASPVEGYHVSGIGTRIVAWFLDVSILTIVTLVILVVALIVAGDAFAQNDLAVTGLTAILTVGLSFLYFIGPWTGSSGATLGMRSVGLRVVSVPLGRTLEIGPAVVRWVALGWPAAFLALIPVLGTVASWGLTGWTIVLLLTTAMSDTKQGLHDRFAGSAVLRRNGAGSGWAVVGCLLIIGALILLAFILPLLLLTTLPPEFWEEFQRQLQLELERQS